MKVARNNIVVEIKNTNPKEYAIMNPITGCFDLMDNNEFTMYRDLSSDKKVDKEFLKALLERGYVFNNAEDENKAIEAAYKEFNEEVKNSQTQLMLVPTYSCNFACTYCFQHGIEGRPSMITKEQVDAFFEYAKKEHGHHSIKPFITLFGGEPLINSKRQREIADYVIDKCVENGYEFSAVTNGYDVIDYMDSLNKVKVKELQFTLDGSKLVHDARRKLANNNGTFDRIIQGMEAAINAGMPINLRMVVDLENINDTVALAEFLDKKGWLDLPPELFKTQIGRNYELFECYAKPQHLMSQVELWGEYSRLSKEYPVLQKFHRPDFKGVRHLVDTGEMYLASFDTCPACKTEWVFDLYGNIYGCTASCGREEHILGTYWPEVKKNQKVIDTWKKRDVKTIEKCKTCQYDVICGGGCGVVAANQNNGEILSPDCRPVGELIDIGINHYYDEIVSLSKNDAPLPSHNSCCSTPNDNIANVCGCGSSCTQGCIFCGEELNYQNNTNIKAICGICEKEFNSNVTCKNGHFVCDNCHSSDILGKVEQVLINSSIIDPVELAEKIFEIPTLNMHGPEYHSIVPAILVAAYQNHIGEKDPSQIKDAIKRGKDTKGGSCGYHGNCGAGVGAGISYSILEGATPMSKESRGNAMFATSLALLDISKFWGPRCCKRDSITTIISFVKNFDFFEGVNIKEHSCKQYFKNKDCLGKKCPYLKV